MGRYAQARRRGGSPPQPAPAPPAPVSLASVVWISGPDYYEMNWSGPVTYDGSGGLDGFDVNADPVFSCIQTGPTVLRIQFVSQSGAGQAWELTDQPTQISETVVQPDSGLTS